MRLTHVFLMAIAVSAPVSAQTIYKCKDANGNMVFSQRPCAPSAVPMCMDSDGVERPGACQKTSVDPDIQQMQQEVDSMHGHSQSQAAAPKQNSDLKAVTDEVADYDCRKAANALYAEPDTSEVERLRRQIAGLESSSYVNSRTGAITAASQRMEQEDRIRAASLRAALATKESQISAMRADSERAVRDAMVRCDQQKSQREKTAE